MMLKCIRATLFAAVLCFGFSAYAQPLPCPAGTMANVVGTSCSVGPIIFNFGNDFQGSSFSGFFGGQITPADIGFIPVQSDNKVGFRLVLNFVDAPASGFNSDHFVSFSYTPQAAPGSEIRVQSLSMDAHVQGYSRRNRSLYRRSITSSIPIQDFLKVLTRLTFSKECLLPISCLTATYSRYQGFLAPGLDLLDFPQLNLAPFQPQTLLLLLHLPHFCTPLVLSFLFPDWPR